MLTYDTANGSTVEAINVGPEVEFILRDAAGHTIATVRMDEDTARNLLYDLADTMPRDPFESFYDEGYADGQANR